VTSVNHYSTLEDAVADFFTSHQINIVGAIEDHTEDIARACLIEAKRNGIDSVLFVIDSPGGQINNAVSIVNTLHLYQIPADAIVTGTASSSAFMLLQVCRRRIAYPTATFCMHWGQYTLDNTALAACMNGDNWPLEAMRTYLMQMYAIDKSRVNIPEEQLIKMMNEERIFTASQALDMGFIDEIIDVQPTASFKKPRRKVKQ
jgi:ATP-dependent protease ClpP protease subunit